MEKDRIQINGEWYVKEQRTEMDVDFSEVAEWENDEVVFKFTNFLYNNRNLFYVDICDKATKVNDVSDNDEWIYTVFKGGEEGHKFWCDFYPEKWYELFRDFLIIVNEEKGWLNEAD